MSEIEWTIGGAPADIADWQAVMVAPGGFDRFTGTVRASKVNADQGSPVVGYRPDGTVLYYGEVVASPKVSQGMAYIAAQGPKARLEKYRSRFPYQMRDYSLWTPADADPHGYTGLSDNIGFETQHGQLKWSVDDGINITDGEFYRAVLWTPGFPVYRIAFTFRQTATTTVWELRIQSSVGPTGGINAVATQSLSGATTIDVTQTLTGTDDLIALSLHRVGTGTTTLYRTFRAVNLRVNDWAASDNMSPSDIVVDLGARLGFDTFGVKTSAPNCLPVDFTGTAAELLTYMDVFDSFRWLALEKTDRTPYRLTRAPWTDQQWRASSERGAFPDLEPLELFNKVTQPYNTTAGSPATVSLTASPDPLSGLGITNEYLAEDLADDQPNSTLATTAASELLTQVSVRQVRGSVRLARVWGDDAEHMGWDVTAGGMLSVVDHDPVIPAQKIVTATYSPGGVVDVALGEDVSIDGVLATVAGKAARRRR